MTIIGYKHSPHMAHDDATIRRLLADYVEAIRDVTMTRTGADERRARDIEQQLHTAVYKYAQARRE